MSVMDASKRSHGVRAAVSASVRQPSFVLCVAALVLLTAVFYGTTWNLRLRKLRADLRAPLGTLDKAALRPYRCVDVFQINPETIDTLGTDQYIQWLLVDDDVKDDASPVKTVILFVTYYTGQPDPVPHIPENCYLGAGYLVSASEDWNIDIPALGRQIPARALELEKKGKLGTERPVVTYTFGVNGRFAVDRNEVRTVIGAPWEAYAYFSKVEARFQSPAGVAPSRPEAMAATAKLFRKLIPLLAENHWPDWKALHEKPASASQPAVLSYGLFFPRPARAGTGTPMFPAGRQGAIHGEATQ